MAKEVAVKENDESSEVVEKETQNLDSQEEAKPLFDPQAFIEGLANEQDAGNMESIDEEEEEKGEVKESVKDDNVVAEVEPPVSVNDSNEPQREYTQEEIFINKLSTDLGVDGGTYSELIENINRKQVIVQDNELVKRIDGLAAMNDDALVKSWLGTRPDYTEDEVDERIEIWRSQGELKHQAKDIRSQLNERRQQYIDEEKNKKISEEAKRKEIAEGFNKGLNEAVSKTSSLYDGAFSLVDDEKKSLVEYITTGQFQKDILSAPMKLIEAAHFVKNRDVAIKIIRQQGVSDGTQKALGNIRPIDGRTGGYIPNDGSKGIFDARKFMSGFDDKKG
jgi:hypothetical protein